VSGVRVSTPRCSFILEKDKKLADEMSGDYGRCSSTWVSLAVSELQKRVAVTRGASPPDSNSIAGTRCGNKLYITMFTAVQRIVSN